MRTTALSALTLLAATGALARTDLSGCVSSATVKYGGASLIWYVPGTGEICDFLDCGGGRAPPKTTVPGCAAYQGTATYSPDYLPGYGPNAAPTTSSAAATSAAASPSVTAAPSYGAPSSSSTTTDMNDGGDDENYTYPDDESSAFSTSCSTSAAYASSGASTLTPVGTPWATPAVPQNPINGGASSSKAVGTPSATTPGAASFTGAAVANGVAKEVMGLAAGVVAGLALL